MEVVNIVINVLLVLFSIVLIAVVLMQSSKSTGLGGAFGGDTQSLSGRGKAASREAKLQKITVVTSIIIGVLAIALAVIN